MVFKPCHEAHPQQPKRACGEEVAPLCGRMGFSPSHPRHPDPSARSPHECARDPPVGCASAAGLPLCVRSDGTVAHVAPPAPPRGVAPPGQVTALCAVARVVIGTVNLDFFGFFLFSTGPPNFARSNGVARPRPGGPARRGRDGELCPQRGDGVARPRPGKGAELCP